MIVDAVVWLGGLAVSGIIAWRRAKASAAKESATVRAVAATIIGALETAPPEIGKPAKDWVKAMSGRLGIESTRVYPTVHTILDDLASDGRLSDFTGIAASLKRRDSERHLAESLTGQSTTSVR